MAVLMCLVALCGGGLVLTRSGGGAGADEEADVISQEEAEGIADDIITEGFSDLEGAERIIGSYENPAGTEFWTMRDGKVALWEATFNVWEAGGEPVSPLV